MMPCPDTIASADPRCFASLACTTATTGTIGATSFALAWIPPTCCQSVSNSYPESKSEASQNSSEHARFQLLSSSLVMPSRFLLIIVFCISLCFAAIASGQNGRFRNSRRYTPSNYFAAPPARAVRLSSEQMDRIYGPSILVRSQRKPAQPASSFVIQPR